MKTLTDLETRREEILASMHSIRSMKRASLNEQYLKVPHQGHKEPALRGPYYVMSWREDGKTIGKRLTTEADLTQARNDIEAHKRFMTLCQEYVRLTERLGELDRARDSEEEMKKKQRNSRSSKMKR
jgi:hypothetical protein